MDGSEQLKLGNNLIRVCETMLKPQQIAVPSSSGDGQYLVVTRTIYNDYICTCPGFNFRGECKHIKEVDEKRCKWHIAFKGNPRVQQNRSWACPECHNPTVVFNLEPEFE